MKYFLYACGNLFRFISKSNVLSRLRQHGPWLSKNASHEKFNNMMSVFTSGLVLVKKEVDSLAAFKQKKKRYIIHAHGGSDIKKNSNKSYFFSNWSTHPFMKIPLSLGEVMGEIGSLRSLKCSLYCLRVKFSCVCPNMNSAEVSFRHIPLVLGLILPASSVCV